MATFINLINARTSRSTTKRDDRLDPIELRTRLDTERSVKIHYWVKQYRRCYFWTNYRANVFAARLDRNAKRKSARDTVFRLFRNR